MIASEQRERVASSGTALPMQLIAKASLRLEDGAIVETVVEQGATACFAYRILFEARG